MTNPLITNVAIGKWYPKGQERLFDSLVEHGWNSYKGWINEYPTQGFNESNPYTCKASALEYALQNNRDVVLWCDASIYAIKPVDELMQLVNDKGYFFWASGENCAQTVSDRCLDIFDLSRNEAELITECATSVFGVNLNTEIGRAFAERFIYYTAKGAADGSRYHDNQSLDKRFKYHRQDQSVASLVMHQLDMKIEPVRYVGYTAYLSEYQDTSKICLLNQGM